MNEGIDDVTLTDMINEVDLNQNGKLELSEFLEVLETGLDYDLSFCLKILKKFRTSAGFGAANVDF